MQPLTCDLWLMEPNAMRQFVKTASAMPRLSLEEVRASRGEPSRKQQTVGIIPIHGVLEARSSLIGELLGMSSYESIGYAFDSLVNDDSVKGIILDVMSPGGMAYGAPELANKIFQARGTKPIVSVANPLAASGGYWLAAAADRVVMTPSANVGSVGVIHEHVSFARAAEQDGLDVTVTRSTDAPYKAQTNSMEPLTDSAREDLQQMVDEIHANFAGDLARFRGVSVDFVNENFGKGRVVSAKQAMKAGMVDQVMTLQDVVVKMAAGRIRIASNRAEDEWNAPTVRESRLQQVAQVRSALEIPQSEN